MESVLDLKPDTIEVAHAIKRIEDRILYKKNQLQKALGRRPYPGEVLSVCGREIDVLGDLYEAVARNDLVRSVPSSLLGPIFFKKFMETAYD